MPGPAYVAPVRGRVGLLLCVALLAGCAGDAPPLVAGEPTFSDAALPPGSGFAPLRWSTVANGVATLTPATPAQASTSLPTGSLAAYVNLTPRSGAAHGFAIALGECDWRRDVMLVGPGAEIAADCGGVQGNAGLQIATGAGALDVEWRVVAMTCDPREGICPPRLPIGG